MVAGTKKIKKLSYFINYRKPGNVVPYAVTAGGGTAYAGVAPAAPAVPIVPTFIALYYTKAIMDKAGRTIGVANYDMKIYSIQIEEDGISGQMNGQYTAVHKIKKGNKNFTVRMNGDIWQSLSSSEKKPMNYANIWKNINNSKISSVVANHLVEIDSTGKETLFSDPQLNVYFDPIKPTMYRVNYLPGSLLD